MAQIIGVSSARAIAEARSAAGAIDRGATLAEAAGAADLIFLSQTIGRILDTLRHLDPLVKPGALVTDAGSTKCEIVDTAMQHLTRCQFLGGHPMAGKESRGAAEASADRLLRANLGADAGRSRPSWKRTRCANSAAGLTGIGARVAVLDCEEHDGIVALTSHLPQLASTALAATLQERCSKGKSHVSGSGLTDMTRLALSSYDLWRDILATNADRIDRALAAYIQEARAYPGKPAHA